MKTYITPGCEILLMPKEDIVTSSFSDSVLDLDDNNNNSSNSYGYIQWPWKY